MRITEVGTTKSSAVTKKNKGKITSDFGSILDEASAAEDSASLPEVAAPASINMIDSLIAVQQAESQYDSSEESISYGKELLGFLDEIKSGMLEGGVSMEKLQKLKNGIKKERGWVVDDKLSSVLNEIEIRAKVEIAKLDSNRS